MFKEAAEFVDFEMRKDACFLNGPSNDGKNQQSINFQVYKKGGINSLGLMKISIFAYAFLLHILTRKAGNEMQVKNRGPSAATAAHRKE